MGQGFLYVVNSKLNDTVPVDSADDTSGYNPPKFVLDAAKEALNRVDANQYSPTKVSNILRITAMLSSLPTPSRAAHG